MKCPECAGTGSETKTDIMTATVKKDRCEFCKGTGLIQEEIKDGLMVRPEPGQLFYFSLFIDGRTRAVMTTVLEGIVPDPQNPKNKYLVVKIIQMTTKSKYRKKGYMEQILDGVKRFAKGEVKFIITNWYDSTDEGRKFLQKRGFKREKNILIWRKYEKQS